MQIVSIRYSDQQLRLEGVAHEVASGNSKRVTSAYSPTSNQKVISISSVSETEGQRGSKGRSYGKDDSFSTYSEFGPAVDIWAPAVDMYSTYKGSSYKTLIVTSMAAPRVSGAIAFYKVNTNPSALPDEIINALSPAGSNSQRACDGNSVVYFTNDPDIFAESVLYVGNF
jgi:subtilisin